MMQEDTQPVADSLFIALTRPPIAMGVPMTFFGINFMVFGVLMIGVEALMAKAIAIALVNLPIHAFGYLMTERDPHWMGVITTKFNKCGPTRNKHFWKVNSYSP